MTFAATRIQGTDMPSREKPAATKLEGSARRRRDGADAGGEQWGYVNNAGTVGYGIRARGSAGVWMR